VGPVKDGRTAVLVQAVARSDDAAASAWSQSRDHEVQPNGHDDF